jgi:hypothetical protein
LETMKAANLSIGEKKGDNWVSFCQKALNPFTGGLFLLSKIKCCSFSQIGFGIFFMKF